jgi:hypothetical protein
MVDRCRSFGEKYCLHLQGRRIRIGTGVVGGPMETVAIGRHRNAEGRYMVQGEKCRRRERRLATEDEQKTKEFFIKNKQK